MAEVIEITKGDDFQDLITSTRYVIADFYASWCPPCKAIAPLYAGLAKTHAAKGRLAFAKINVDDVSEIAKKYGVSAMPTFMFFVDGKPQPIDVEVPKSPAAVLGEGGLLSIKGADPRVLTTVAKKLGELSSQDAPPAVPSTTATDGATE